MMTKAHKITAALLALALLLTMLPLTAVSVGAATEEHPDAITITVIDEDDNPVEDAEIDFCFDSVSKGDKYIEKEKEKTDAHGTLELLKASDFVSNDLTLTAVIKKEGFKTDESIDKIQVKNANQDFKITLISTTPHGVSAKANDLTYNGKPQLAVEIKKEETDTVTFNFEDERVELREDGPYVTDAGDYEFDVKIEREDFEPYEKTIKVTVKQAELSDVVIEGKTVKYNAGNLLELVEVTGIDENKDTVTYSCENENVTMPTDGSEIKVPSASAIGKYQISVKVERDANYKTIEKDIEAEVQLGEINLGDLTIRGLDSTYTGEPQDALIITGSEEASGYKLDYKIDENEWTDDLSEITVTDAGDYLVKVRATRTYYEDKDVPVDSAARAEYPFNVHIEKAPQSVEFNNYVLYGTTAVVLDKDNADNNIYDFSAKGGVTDKDIVYSVVSSSGDVPSTVAEIGADGKLTIKGAGSFSVVATKPGSENYKDGVATHNIVVTDNSADLLSMDSEVQEYVFGKNSGVVSDRKATRIKPNDNGEITYTIDSNDIGLSCDSKTGEIKISDYTKLSEKLETSGGTVTATVTAHKAEGTQTVTREVEDQTPDGMKVVYFTNTRGWEKVYGYWWKGSEYNSAFPGEQLNKVAINDFAQDIYRMYLPTDAEGMIFSNGLSGDSLQQTEDIKEIKNSFDYYHTGESGNKVSSVEWTKKITSMKEVTDSIFGSCEAQYSVKISSIPVPSTTYELSGTKGNDNWYVSDVTATAADSENYQISSTPDPKDFAASAVFKDQGTESRYVYLMDKDGAITPKIELEGLKIDQVKPDANNMSITFDDEDVKSETIKDKQYKFNKKDNDKVNVTFTVIDEDSAVASEIKKIKWKYTRDGSVSSILEEDGGEVEVTKTEDVPPTYQATITLTAEQAKQYRGKLSFTATDTAGNESDHKTEDSIAVLDTVNPRLMDAIHEKGADDVEYYPEEGESGTIHFYSGDIKFSFVIKEANFFAENVDITLTKDGKKSPTPNVTWSDDDDVHTGTFTISGDGDYKVYMEYADRSENIIKDKNGESEIKKYESEQLTIDATNPVLAFEYNREEQSIKFTVTEHNFRASAINVTESAVDLNGVAQTLTKDINTILHDAGNWKKVENKSDTYQLEYKELDDGIYTYDIAYTDVAGNIAMDITGEHFVIDHSAPSDITISYSKPWNETLLGAVTFGFYNPDVTVTFTAVDKFSGVKTFNWDYTRLDGASEKCEKHLADKANAVLKSEEDKTLFTAQITLPAEEVKDLIKRQLKGNISVNATDGYNNTSDTVGDDKNVVVVDTISPKATVKLSDSSRDYNGTRYYGKDKKGEAVATFYVEESNFFPEDFKVTVAESGGSANPVSVSWTDSSVDDHVGVVKLKGDGHYTIFAEYTDRSMNKMDSYQSEPITIDTIAPVINVQYQNKDVIETLTDREDHERDYFDTTQTAVVTITEHNFFEGGVDFSDIISKDITGEPLDIDDLSSRSKWTNLGDVHTITLTYSGDANYTFDLNCEDLAKNTSKDYQPDYFTVDTVAPSVQSVSYSTSVRETVISNISFGFYGATMEVTLTATDNIAGVHGFEYSYRNAPGVSSVNDELIRQAMDEGSITYSNGGATASLVFSIPRDALGPSNQFNGLVDFETQDRSHNSTAHQEDKRIVVDNIAPVCSVDLGNPVNQRGGVSYYNGAFTGTITINEANFYSEDVNVTYTANGSSAGALPVTWSDESVDTHIGTFTLSSEGDYTINITYTDKSGNTMDPYTSNQLTIDTHIDEPTFTINGTEVKGDNGGAYKDDINVGYAYSDQNFDTRTIELVRTRFNEVKDVTDEFIKDTPDAKGGQGSFSIPKEVGNDGIYVLTISMSDLANHTVESHVKFTVNRFGSVYEYSDYLMTLIKDGGQYIKKGDDADAAITNDLVITEYNADKLVKDSLNITITRDSEPVKAEFKSNPVASDDVEIGASGWYQYEYVIDKKNFTEDGVYKISLSSKDKTDNESTSVPENSITKSGAQVLDTMTFTVDTTLPEIRNIINLDHQIVNAEELDVKYSLVDIGGLKNVEIMVDDTVVDTINNFDNLHDYNGSFTLKEKNTSQNIRLIITDIAGNITDTASDDFDTKDMYQFYDTITLSTNLFVRWFANKPLFYGSIGGAVLLLIGIGFLIAYANKKKKKQG